MNTSWDTLKLVADPTRLRILALLLREELSVAELPDILDMAQSRISSSLALLRSAELVSDRRDGKRALDIATAVNDAEPIPVHAETIALALAELGRCSEAMEWMKRAIASAERGKNVTEAARLNKELGKYQGVSCRP